MTLGRVCKLYFITFLLKLLEEYLRCESGFPFLNKCYLKPIDSCFICSYTQPKILSNLIKSAKVKMLSLPPNIVQDQISEIFADWPDGILLTKRRSGKQSWRWNFSFVFWHLGYSFVLSSVWSMVFSTYILCPFLLLTKINTHIKNSIIL